jgi:hypothetical protein
VVSQGDEYTGMSELFLEKAGYKGMCVTRYLELLADGSNALHVGEQLNSDLVTSAPPNASAAAAADVAFAPVLLLLSRADAVTLLRDKEVRKYCRNLFFSFLLFVFGFCSNFLIKIDTQVTWQTGKLNERSCTTTSRNQQQIRTES